MVSRDVHTQMSDMGVIIWRLLLQLLSKEEEMQLLQFHPQQEEQELLPVCVSVCVCVPWCTTTNNSHLTHATPVMQIHARCVLQLTSTASLAVLTLLMNYSVVTNNT